MPTKISIAAARRPEAVGREVLLQGWVRTRRDSKAGFSFLEINDGSSHGNLQVVAAATLPNYETEIKQLAAGSSVSVSGHVAGLAGQGPGHRGPGAERRSSTAGPTRSPIRCRRKVIPSSSFARLPICGRAPTPSGPWPGCATASAARSTSSSRRKASSTSIRRSSRPATAKGPARCSRSPRSTWTSPPRIEAAGRFHPGLLRPPHVPDRQRPARGRDLRLRPGQGLHLRPHLPRRELQHLPPPGRVLDGRAGDGLLRAGRQHGPGRAVPQADLPRRAGRIAARTWSSSTSGSTTR